MSGFKVLVANRGEIAIRVFRAAKELGWRTVALYTQGDTAHATYADEAAKLENVSGYMDAQCIVDHARRFACTHVHPGYGFLSESPELASILLQNGSTQSPLPSISFVGPSVDTLRVASNKMLSRELAMSLDIPVAAGGHVRSVEDILTFVDSPAGGFPVIVKALDGGGGRGIRIIQNNDQVNEAFQRCTGESPSRRLFVEKALVGRGWKHVEVQILGDGSGQVMHLWERECSTQRRFQKIVEVAPSSLSRAEVQPLLDASLKMAGHLNYLGLGTFEFLVNALSGQWIFLEINPRIQVEHTITEEIMNFDLVRAQLLLSLPSTSLSSVLGPAYSEPQIPIGHAVQLRLTAEDPDKSFQLATGIIRASELSWPAGRGVRVDTWLSSSPSDICGEPTWQIGTDFDSLLAKVIVHGNTFQEATQRAARALGEIRLPRGVRTNVELLAGVMRHPDWLARAIDIGWLERNVAQILEIGASASRIPSGLGLGKALENQRNSRFEERSGSMDSGSGTVFMRPGNTFQLTVSTAGDGPSAQTTKRQHTLTLSSIVHNSFPNELSGTLNSTLSPTPLTFSLVQSSMLNSSSIFESPDPSHPGHIASPITGKVVEFHPAFQASQSERTPVRAGETLAVISVMKMETVVLAPIAGYVQRLGRGVELGVVIGEGVLLCVMSPDNEPDLQPTSTLSRL